MPFYTSLLHKNINPLVWVC